MNTFGTLYRLTTFGESHGPAIGGVIDGMPPGIAIDLDRVQAELDRRRPGQSAITTSRREDDKVEILSGIFEGKTTGTPIGFVIRNGNHRSADYGQLRHAFRPGHADFTYTAKYGLRDFAGGGRASARETACRVVGGAFARQALELKGIRIFAYTSQVGAVKIPLSCDEVDPSLIDTNPVRCPHAPTAAEMEQLIKRVKTDGDTIGGIVTCVAAGVPAGLGEPVYGKLSARLAEAMMGINAAKGFDYGTGFDVASMLGSQIIDPFETDSDGRIVTTRNHSGGIQGGISNGAPVYFRVAFKPVATLMREVATVDDCGNPTVLKAAGRHDPCVVPRAVPVVEAMTAITLLDSMIVAGRY